MGRSDEPIEVGGRVGDRYVIEALLGRGGMGAVYRVRDEHSGRRVALKRGWAREARKVERRSALLEREYYTLSQLAHPSIIEVYDYGVDEHGPYYTMELLDGADLEKAGRLPWQRACAVLCDVASSLAILHARGLIHRDVSSRNVRAAGDGRAKLLDFGAMAPLGVVREVVGTPPFMAPEALQLQELDGRADLFALGALGYFAVSGRHAYPARRLSELRDVWRSRPPPLARLVPDMPQALAALLHELLTLDRNGRPRLAAEVIERLRAIAGLPAERVEVSRAYLSRPTLIARNEALGELRRRLLALMRGAGNAVLLHGAAGSGRSRMLDAAVLEARLLNVAVVRAGAGDAVHGDFGVARALCTQLFELMPRPAEQAARLGRDVLGHVIERLRDEQSEPLAWPDRSLLLRQLRDFVLSLCRTQPLLLVVDDVDAIDEPSAALLAALAHKAERQPLLLVMAAESGRPRDAALAGALDTLRRVACGIELAPLSSDETEALLRSVFGDVANLQLVAGRIHALASGRPRAIMDLAQHLVQRGLCRYEAGSWSLPAELEAGDLPATLAEALVRNLALLDDDARELAEALCLAEGDGLAIEDYPALVAGGDRGRVFRALDQLVAEGVLRVEGARYRFGQQGMAAVLSEHMPPARRAAIHARIASVLAERGGDPVRVAHHLLHGGREREALELLCGLDIPAHSPPVPLLERAVEAAERLELPARAVQQLRMALLGKASVVLSADAFRRCAPDVLARLEQDSGLAGLRELAHLPEGERLAQALARAQQRYEATPEHERVHAVPDAIRELGRLSGAYCSFAMQIVDLPTLESLPSLAPIAPLSPALQVLAQCVEATRSWLQGRFMHSAGLYRAMLDRIAQPDRAGLDEVTHKRLALGVRYQLGLFEAALGVLHADELAELLESEREHRANAWDVRMLLHLSQGDVEEARRCKRRAELAQLHEGSEQRYLRVSSGLHVAPFAAAGELLGVKSTVETMARLAERHPGWQPYLQYGLCRYRWLQGDLNGALAAAEQGLALAPPARHNAFTYLAGAQVSLLCELGRTDEAVERGRDHAALCEREQLVALDHGIDVGLARAEARAGRYDHALRAIEAAVQRAEAAGATGLALGALIEVQARIAMTMGDRQRFERLVERCAAEYEKARNPGLAARLAPLLEEARRRGTVPPEPARALESLLSSASEPDTAYDTVRSRMIECIDDRDRARCALMLLLDHAERCAGYLFGVRGGEVTLLAALPDAPVEPDLLRWVERCIAREAHAGATVTQNDGEAARSSEEEFRYVDADGRCLEPVFLLHQRGDGSLQVAAVLALHVEAGPRSVPDRELLAGIGAQLVDHGDVTGVTLERDEEGTLEV